MANNWLLPTRFPTLKHREAHVWLVSIKNFIFKLEEYWQTLSCNEKKPAQRFIFTQHRECFIVVHGILRQLLANYLSMASEKINFVYDSYGKPRVENINFNISHSQDLALFAFTKNFDVGIDIEFVKKDFIGNDIARRFFSEYEIQALLKLPIAERKSAFFNCWTRKEAFIKAIGKGLSFPLNKFDVDIGYSQKSLLLNVHNDTYKASDWKLLDLNPHPNYTAALAVSNRITRIRKFNYK
jgi:4'-phosphopantetheinyl transferase